MKTQHIPFSPPDMTEAEANEVRDAILSGWITTGPRTKKLEKLIADYVGVKKCVCLNSQTACGEMSLRLLGIGAGDEVIVPAYTYTASASVVSHVGAKVVFVDVDADVDADGGYTLQMDYTKMADAITERTKAIIPVDLGGIPCDYDKIFEVVEAKKALFHPSNEIQKKLGRVAVCCDAAHALGAWRIVKNGSEQFRTVENDTSNHSKLLQTTPNHSKKMVGAIADFSGFSFHAVKNFTTAEGGALTWNLPFGNEVAFDNVDPNVNLNYFPTVPKKEGETWNELLYRLSQLLSLHGQNKDALAKTKLGAWEYDIIGPWYKCNMTDVAAAMGLIQFERYPGMLARRKVMIEKFNKAIDNINVNLDADHQIKYLKHYTNQYEGCGHLYLVRISGKTREEMNVLIEKMAERGIACNVHYKPLPMMTAYKAMGYDIKDFPNAFKMYENEISLPLNTKMTDEDVDYIIENFTDLVKSF